MNVICTLCSNNHLPRVAVLRNSLKKHDPDARFIIFLADDKNAEIDYTVFDADEIITFAEIEPAHEQLSLKYTMMELAAVVKVRSLEYLIKDRNAAKVLYLDSDTKVFHAVSYLFSELDASAVLLTPHIYTPVPVDGKQPGENTFLNYGLYNLGFIGLSQHPETHQFLSWWKEHTYKEGYNRVEHGFFAEQLMVNLAPVFFKKIKILEDMGLNVAPWNLHERFLTVRDGQHIVNDNTPLKFFHFSNFTVDGDELPLQFYNRFTLAGRPDLQALHRAYNDELKAAGHARFQQYPSVYVARRAAELAKRKRGEKWWRKLLSAKKN